MMRNVVIAVVVIILLAAVGYAAYRYGHHAGKQEGQVALQAAITKPTAMQPKPTNAMMQNSVYKSMSKDKLGMVMTDLKGMTLYTYSKDASGASTCSGKCIESWPAYAAKSQTGSLPENISVIKRSDGTLQYAWKSMPLYYYMKDKDSGDAYGDGVGGVWAVVKQ